MSRGNLLLGFGAGLLSGLLGAVVLMGGQAAPRAFAQVPPQAAPRFSISAWAYPASELSHGAYILDTQSGQVWLIYRDGKPSPIGQVK